MSFDAAVSVEPTGIALNVVKLTGITPADFVCGDGAGTDGAVRRGLARAYGARKVILVGTNPERLAVGARLDADELMTSDGRSLAERVRQARLAAWPTW